MRPARAAAVLILAAAASACAATTGPYRGPYGHAGPPPGPGGPYGPPPPGANGPPPRAAASLRVCLSHPYDRFGPVGRGGEILNFTPYARTPAGPVLRAPAAGVCVTDGFGPRPQARGGRGGFHEGVDLAPRAGRTVFAAAAGRVVSSGWESGYGYAVRIDHGRGVRTLYAHLDARAGAVPRGTRVEAGQPIATMGRTGNATGVHLHYGLSVNGRWVDPLR
jgi:murein DD-endopeptidase MepM/ murein hydrolase activator NlpD